MTKHKSIEFKSEMEGNHLGKVTESEVKINGEGKGECLSAAASLSSGDELQIFKSKEGTFQFLKWKGCSALCEKIIQFQKTEGENPHFWTLPMEIHHEDLLVKELILKENQSWSPPYVESELCHCRAIATETIREAIYLGCHSVRDLVRETTAGSSCGTCQGVMEKLLMFYVGETSD